MRSQCPQHVSQSLGPVRLEAGRVTWRLPRPPCGPALGAFSDPGGWSKGTRPPAPPHMQDRGARLAPAGHIQQGSQRARLRMMKTGHVGTNTWGEGQRGRCVLQEGCTGPGRDPYRQTGQPLAAVPGPFHGTYAQWPRQQGQCRLCRGQGRGLPELSARLPAQPRTSKDQNTVGG